MATNVYIIRKPVARFDKLTLLFSEFVSFHVIRYRNHTLAYDSKVFTKNVVTTNSFIALNFNNFTSPPSFTFHVLIIVSLDCLCLFIHCQMLLEINIA